jgi:hypothetical protein
MLPPGFGEDVRGSDAVGGADASVGADARSYIRDGYIEDPAPSLDDARPAIIAAGWRNIINALPRSTGGSQRHSDSPIAVGYRSAFDEGAELLRWAGILEDLSAVVLDNLDALVESSYEGEPRRVPGVNPDGQLRA